MEWEGNVTWIIAARRVRNRAIRLEFVADAASVRAAAAAADAGAAVVVVEVFAEILEQQHKIASGLVVLSNAIVTVGAVVKLILE